MSDFSHLPPELRDQLRAKLLEFLAEIGVQPMVDSCTGELLVPLADMARAMGRTEAEIRAELAGVDGMVNADPATLSPLN
jgi:hypothetical protein